MVCTRWWAGELPYRGIRFCISHLSRYAAILSGRAQKMHHQIARQVSRGHRMVRRHTHRSLYPTLMRCTDPLFFMHHAVSDLGWFHYITEMTPEIAVLDDR